MPRFLISFPSSAMQVPADELEAVADAAHAVADAARAAGIHVFSGGIDEGAGPVRVHADGTVTPGSYPGVDITGGFTIIDVPDRATAEEWARRIAVACRCPQEVRAFGADPREEQHG